jgi:hypothetical protein
MKKLFLAPVLFLWCTLVMAQTDPLRDQLNLVFANVNKSLVPTGFLQEYGMPLVPLETFNGVLASSNKADIYVWRMAYASLQTSRIYGTNPLAALSTVNADIAAAETANGSAPSSLVISPSGALVVPMLYADYNYLRPDAITANLLSASNNQLYDVAGRTQSPYYTRTAFAASPSIGYAATGTPSFVFKQNLFYKVSSKTLSQISIDFGDGRGYLSASWDVPIAAAYTAVGAYTLKIKLTFTDNSTVETYSPFQVTQVAQVLAQSFFAGGATSVPFPAVSGVHSGGQVFYQLSVNNSTGRIRKPLIVVEGYDVSSIAPLLQRNYSYNNFINEFSNASPYDFNYQLDNVAGYDLIFLDYANGTDDIVRNAALLKEVIVWVNQQKALGGSTQKNVVMGISMGGLVARYCLANMTKQGTDPQTRLLLTHDSPHQGANTPLGFTSLTRALFEVALVQGLNAFDLVPQIKQAVQVLDAPATNQLLIIRAINGYGGYATNTFLNTTYRNMITFQASDPQPAYQVEATSLGSECGTGPLTTGASLLHINGQFFLSPVPWILSTKYNTDIVVNALPAYGSTQKIMGVKVWITFKILSFININVTLTDKSAISPANTLPWDSAPGGTQNVAQQAGSNIPSVNYSFGPFFNLSLNATYAGDFCFVPTVSALDISSVTTAALASSYVGGINPTNPARVANFIAQERFTGSSGNAYNQSHPRFTARNAQWMYREMESPAGNTLNCSSDCVINYGGSVSGPSIVCAANATFTVSGVSSYATSVSWTKSTNLNYVSGQNTNSYTVNSNATGAGSVTATPSGRCGAGKGITQNISVGTGAPPSGITIGRDDCYDQRFSTDYAGGAAVYQWTMINTSTNSMTFYPNHNYQLVTGLGAGSYHVVVASACPSPLAAEAYFTIVCSGGPKLVAVSPNPASSQLVVASQPVAAESIASNASIDVSLVDNTGTVVRSTQLKEGQEIELDVTGLKKGVYFLHVRKGDHTDSRHILIE